MHQLQVSFATAILLLPSDFYRSIHLCRVNAAAITIASSTTSPSTREVGIVMKKDDYKIETKNKFLSTPRWTSGNLKSQKRC